MLHVDVPPELEQYGEVCDIAGRVYSTCCYVIAAMPWFRRADVVQYLCVSTVPAHHKLHL